MKKVCETLVCAAVVVMSLGCGGTFRPSQVNTMPLEMQEHVIYKNFWLKSTVGVLSAESQNQDGFVKAAVKFKNLTSSQINAEIKVKFLDRSGMELADSWGWAPFPLESGEIKTFQRTAPSKSASDYRVFLKLASDSGD